MPRHKKNVDLDIALEETIEISDAFNNYLDEKLEDDLFFAGQQPTVEASKTETDFMRRHNHSSMMLGGNYESHAETTFGQIKDVSWKKQSPSFPSCSDQGAISSVISHKRSKCQLAGSGSKTTLGEGEANSDVQEQETAHPSDLTLQRQNNDSYTPASSSTPSTLQHLDPAQKHQRTAPAQQTS